MSKKEVAKDFPMLYLLVPIKAQELRSKVSIEALPVPEASVQPGQTSYDTMVDTTDASPSVDLSYETEVA
jgi:hypothetical protein